MEIPAIKLGKGVKMITANTTESGVGNFTYMNGYNFYPETVTNGKCGEEFKGFCMRNRYCNEWGNCDDKQITKREDHKKNATDNARYRLCNSANDGECLRYLEKKPDYQGRFTHSYNVFMKKY